MPKLLLAACAALLTLFLAPAAFAYEVGPLRMFLSPAQGRSSATVSVNNTRDEELLFEVKVLRRIVARDGSQALEPVDADFTVFPLQARVAAKKSQAVRIQYRGAPITADSKSYVIQIAEVPVMKPGFSGVRFAYNFGVAVYVDAARAEANVKVAPAPRAVGGELRFSAVNSGRAFGFTTGHALRYQTTNGQSVTIEPDALAKLISAPIIPPSATRDFAIPAAGLADGSVTSVELINRAR